MNIRRYLAEMILSGDQLDIETACIIAQTKETYHLNNRIKVSSLEGFLNQEL